MKPIEENGKIIIEAEGQRLAVPFWRKGFMKDARTLVYRYVFEELKIDEIYAQAWAENDNSCKSMENYGFTLVEVYDRMFEKRRKIFKERLYMLDQLSYKTKYY